MPPASCGDDHGLLPRRRPVRSGQGPNPREARAVKLAALSVHRAAARQPALQRPAPAPRQDGTRRADPRTPRGARVTPNELSPRSTGTSL